MIADLSIIRFCAAWARHWLDPRSISNVKLPLNNEIWRWCKIPDFHICNVERRAKERGGIPRNSFIKKINIQLFRWLINNDILVLVATDKIFRRRKVTILDLKIALTFQTIKLSTVFETRFQITKCILRTIQIPRLAIAYLSINR